MKNLAIATAAIAAATAAIAAPTVSNVSMTQSNSQTVKVAYTLDEAAVVTLDVLTNATGEVWASIGADNIKTLWGDVNVLVQPGSHTLYWAPEKDWIEAHPGTYDVQAAVKAWAVTAPPDYMVVDLRTDNLRAGAPKIRYFETAEQVPDGVTDIKYKTDFIVMRKIHAKGMTYRMGSPSSERGRTTSSNYDNWSAALEDTYHITLTNDFYLGIYELTRKQAVTWTGYGNSGAVSGYEAYPVGGDNGKGYIYYENMRGTAEQVSNGTVLQELKSKTGIDFDLPTEAQWEFACRAGTSSALYNGKELEAWNVSSTLDDIAWYSANSGQQPHEVGLKQPNAFGLYDMLGNVSEGCRDVMSGELHKAFRNAESGAFTDPVATGSESQRVARGGNYSKRNSGDDHACSCRSAFRHAYYTTGSKYAEYGFRLWAPAIAK